MATLFKGVTPEEVDQVLNGAYNEALLAETVDMINTKLSNKEWLDGWVRNQKTNPTWVFVCKGTLSPSDKAELTKIYVDAGWGAVQVQNSIESNEPPGLFTVTLRKNNPTAG